MYTATPKIPGLKHKASAQHPSFKPGLFGTPAVFAGLSFLPFFLLKMLWAEKVTKKIYIMKPFAVWWYQANAPNTRSSFFSRLTEQAGSTRMNNLIDTGALLQTFLPRYSFFTKP
jgi:hypothetical protein